MPRTVVLHLLDLVRLLSGIIMVFGVFGLFPMMLVAVFEADLVRYVLLGVLLPAATFAISIFTIRRLSPPEKQ